MITLKKFLNEEQQTLFSGVELNEQTIEKIVKLIKHDCGPYLQEIKDPINVVAYRGIRLQSYKSYPIFIKKDVRQDRKPKDTNKQLSLLVDNWFNKKFGIRFRSQAIFVSGDAFIAKNFGSVFIIFPIGDYDYCWSKIYGDLTEDLTDAIASSKTHFMDEYSYLNNEFSNIKEKHIDEFMKDGKYKFNKDLIKALSMKVEVMIKCKSYYALDAGWETDYSEILKRLK